MADRAIFKSKKYNNEGKGDGTSLKPLEMQHSGVCFQSVGGRIQSMICPESPRQLLSDIQGGNSVYTAALIRPNLQVVDWSLHEDRLTRFVG